MKNLIRAVAGMLALTLAMEAGAQCTGDLNGNGTVDGADLGSMLAYWGPRTQDPFSIAADLDSDALINGADLGILLANWGACPIPAWGTVIDAQPDPTVVTDPTLRAAIQAAGLPWRVRDTATGIEMLLIPPGTFQMGCIMGSNQYTYCGGERPVHQVTLTTAFYLGRYELTQSQWVAKMGSNPSGYQGSSRPVDSVTWNAVQGFLSATGMRLPTEAEWEYACRAGTQTPFYNGSTDDNTLGTLAWFYYNTCQGGTGCGTRPVGGKAANGFGLFDMLGNVGEWVNDWYGNYTEDTQTDPAGPASGSYRVGRGGTWSTGSDKSRSSFRGYAPPDGTSAGIGFRVARNP
jgi:formylglycine-generating enzyme required for sulfatase activity